MKPIEAITSEQKKLQQLAPLALTALERMVVKAESMFCYREVWKDNKPRREGISFRYSVITLIGLIIAQKRGLELPGILDVGRLAKYLKQERAENLGDLGLLTWMFALVGADQASLTAETLVSHLEGNSLSILENLDMMHLAWVLVGLSYAYQVSGGDLGLKNLAEQAKMAMIKAFNPQSGLFYRFAVDGKPLSRWNASFAMEIYPVYALATYADIFGDRTVLDYADACAACLSALQLPDGGWPWMYDVRHGRVIEPLPVYSVHQDGMAPMALLKLMRQSGKDYSAAVAKGIAWLRHNRLGINMIDTQRQIIWRAQEIPRLFGLQPRLAINALLALVLGKGLISFGPVRLVRECRPYHLGWLLLAAFE